MDLRLLESRLITTDNDKKIESLNSLKQGLIDGLEIENNEHLIQLLKSYLKSNNINVILAALSCLPHLFPLLVSSSTSSSSTPITKSSIELLPFDKLGDSNKKVRELARESIISASVTILHLGINFGDLTASSSSGKDKEGPWTYLSRLLIEPFTSKNIKIREQSLLILSALRSSSTPTQAPLRPFTSSLLTLLSDPDASIRALALSTTISVFSAPEVNVNAKSDLKKEMIKLDVKDKVQETILSAVLGGGGGSGREASNGSESNGQASTSTATASTTTTTTSPPATKFRPLPTTRATTSSIPSPTATSQPEVVQIALADISPVYIASIKDLNLEFESMKPGFEGKETEFNWMVRDKNIARLRGILRGNVGKGGELSEGYLVGIKSVQEGILKTASSLRTTLATSALSLITELSTTFLITFDPLLEPFLSHTLSMAGQTKKLVATASQSAVTALLTNSNYHLKTIQLIWLGMNDKIVLARTFVSAHLITFIKIHAEKDKNLIESTGGVELLEQCLKKGLIDSNPIVKENTRNAYWLLNPLFPKMTGRVLGGLDVTGTKQLERSDPSKKVATAAVTGGSGSTGSGKSGRPSMKEMIALAKAAPKKEGDQDLLPLSGLSISTGANSSNISRPLVDRTVSAPLPSSTSTTNQPFPSPPPPPQTKTSSPSRPISISSTSSNSSPRKSQIPFSPDAPHQSLGMGVDHFVNHHSSPNSSPSMKVKKIEPELIKDEPEGEEEEDDDDDDEGAIGDGDDVTNLMNSPPPFNGPDSDSENGDLETKLNKFATPLSPQSPQSLISHSLPSLPSPAPTIPPELPPKSPHSHNQNNLILPKSDSTVPAALLDQARQVERTAQRLLEIAQEEREEGSSTPKKNGSSNGNGNAGMSTPVGRKLLVGGGAGDVFEDSPDVGKGGKGGKGWWMKKAESLFSSFPSLSTLPIDSLERLNTINSKITALKSKSIDSNGLRYLTLLSRERPFREEEEEDEVEGEGLSPKKEKEIEEFRISKSFWDEERRFEKLLEGLIGFLLDEKTRDRRETALVLLKNLVQNQFPFISGDEANFYGLLFKLREDPSRSSVAAVESISDIFCSQIEPLYGLGILRTSLTQYLDSASSSSTSTSGLSNGNKFSFGLGLRMMGSFFERLPSEILEEEIPKSCELIKLALNDTQSGDLRRASVNSLVSCQKILKNEIKLYSILGEGKALEKDQLNLLSYYFSKLPGVKN